MKLGIIDTRPSGKSILFGLDGKNYHDWFDSEEEAKAYARTHNIKLPPFNRKFEGILDNYCPANKETN